MNDLPEITRSDEMPETAGASKQAEEQESRQYVLRCYDAAGNASYYSGYYHDGPNGWPRDEIKTFLYEEAKRQGCNDCTCSLIEPPE
jgi:hypothetical protein